MEFLLEALLETVLQIVFEGIVALLDFLLESLLGHNVAERVRVAVSTLFYIVLGVFGGWISVALLPRPIGGGVPNVWVYLVVMPLVVTGVLFLGMKRSRQAGSWYSHSVICWYCVSLSWAFSIGRYFFIR